jgi:hypothetical protein
MYPKEFPFPQLDEKGREWCTCFRCLKPDVVVRTATPNPEDPALARLGVSWVLLCIDCYRINKAARTR